MHISQASGLGQSPESEVTAEQLLEGSDGEVATRRKQFRMKKRRTEKKKASKEQKHAAKLKKQQERECKRKEKEAAKEQKAAEKMDAKKKKQEEAEIKKADKDRIKKQKTTPVTQNSKKRNHSEAIQSDTTAESTSASTGITESKQRKTKKGGNSKNTHTKHSKLGKYRRLSEEKDRQCKGCKSKGSKASQQPCGEQSTAGSKDSESNGGNEVEPSKPRKKTAVKGKQQEPCPKVVQQVKDVIADCKATHCCHPKWKYLEYDSSTFQLSVYWSRNSVGVKVFDGKTKTKKTKWSQVAYFGCQTDCVYTNMILAYEYVAWLMSFEHWIASSKQGQSLQNQFQENQLTVKAALEVYSQWWCGVLFGTCGSLYVFIFIYIYICNWFPQDCFF